METTTVTPNTNPNRMRMIAAALFAIAATALVLALVLITRALNGGDVHSWAEPSLRPAAIAMGIGVLAATVGVILWNRFLAQQHATPALFLTPVEEERVLDAIETFEQRTSGELRVHLEPHLHEKDILEEAKKTFEKLGLTATRERNAVLFFVAVKEHRFAVLGDQGINDKVPAGFWNEVVQHIHDAFAKGQFGDGLVEGIRMAGEKLVEHFPPRADDKNELPNQISRG